MRGKKERAVLRSAVLAFLWLLPAGLAGCGNSGMKTYTRPGFDMTAVKSVAVLPFESLTTDEHAGEKIRRLVMTELLARGVNVIEPGEVMRQLQEQKVRALRSISSAELQKIARELDADAVMIGAVESYKISSGMSVSYPEVSVNFMLIRRSPADIKISDQSIVWALWLTSGGPGFMTRQFGTEGKTLSEAAQKVVKEAIATLF